MKEVLEEVEKEDPVRRRWEVPKTKKGVVRCDAGGGSSCGERCSLAQAKGWCWPHQCSRTRHVSQRDTFGLEVEVARDMCKNWFCDCVCIVEFGDLLWETNED